MTSKERLRNTARILSRCLAIEELDDGYELRYPLSRRWIGSVQAFRADFAEAWPHVRFEVEEDSTARRTVLRIRGPEGTKEWVEGARYVLGEGISRTPTLGFRLLRGWRRATSAVRVLPDFLIIGAKKCGTTTLFSHLVSHPSVRPPLRKETRYFNAWYHLGPRWYRSFFPTVTPKLLAGATGSDFRTGEASVDYLYWPSAAPRVRSLLPRARLIAILRDPVDRAASEYHHNRRIGVESRSFDVAVEQELERIAGGEEIVATPLQRPRAGEEKYTYVHRGLYADQLTVWREHFDESQLFVCSADDLSERPQEVLHDAQDFLGLSRRPLPDGPARLNAAPYPEMSAPLRSRLREFFAPANARLYELLGRDLGW